MCALFVRPFRGGGSRADSLVIESLSLSISGPRLLTNRWQGAANCWWLCVNGLWSLAKTCRVPPTAFL